MKNQTDPELEFVVNDKNKIKIKPVGKPPAYYKVGLVYGSWPHRDDLINMCATSSPNMIGEDRVCDGDVSTALWDAELGMETRLVYLRNEDE